MKYGQTPFQTGKAAKRCREIILPSENRHLRELENKTTLYNAQDW